MPAVLIEEHELPSVEAVLAGTLALMTGYSQALQAELDPAQRLRMSMKVSLNLAALVDHPQLSLGFRQVLLGLRQRWQAISRCTEDAAGDLADGIAGDSAPSGGGAGWRCAAPKRLQ